MDRAVRGVSYSGEVDIEDYEPRRIRLVFRPTTQIDSNPVITADGPTDSPHRYPDGELCCWYPKDPAAQRWVWADGLVSLIDQVRVHLLKEAWWRETGEWLGDAAPHAPKDL
jgi:hypothetical protein